MDCRNSALSLAVLATASSSVFAQEFVTYTLSWSEVVAGTTTPVAAANGRIDPGEGARIAIRVEITPGVGSTASYPAPPAPGTGVIAGFGSMFIDLLGSNLNGGTWSNMASTGPQTTWPPPTPGYPQPNGNVLNCQGGQFVLPGSTANSANPIDNFWRGTWTPSDYTMRTASIASAPAASAGANHTSILIQYGLDPGGNPQYVGKFVPAVFIGTGAVPIAPTPASIAVVGLGALVIGRRRRRFSRVEPRVMNYACGR
jgi:hypothetical protein